jgi:hypothetical protein
MSFKAYDTGYRALGGINVPAGGVPNVVSTDITPHLNKKERKTYKELERIRRIQALQNLPAKQLNDDLRRYGLASSIHFRDNLLKTQRLMNIIHEYERIDNKMKTIPGLFPKHVFEKRRAELERFAIMNKTPNLFDKYMIEEYFPEK